MRPAASTLVRFALPALLAMASQAFAGCYTVFDAGDRVVFQSPRPPVDMSRPLHETLPGRFPAGSHLVFDTEGECPVLSSVAVGNGSRNLGTASPLLTDERTAEAMKVPHKSLGRGVAVVDSRDARMAPGLTVVPSGAAITHSPGGRPVLLEPRNPRDTSMLGGPAR